MFKSAPKLIHVVVSRPQFLSSCWQRLQFFNKSLHRLPAWHISSLRVMDAGEIMRALPSKKYPYIYKLCRIDILSFLPYFTGHTVQPWSNLEDYTRVWEVITRDHLWGCLPQSTLWSPVSHSPSPTRCKIHSQSLQRLSLVSSHYNINSKFINFSSLFDPGAARI